MPNLRHTISSENLRRFLKRATSRTTLLYLAVGVLLIVAVIAAGREIEHNIDAIESWIAHIGPWGIVAFIGLYVATTSFLVPTTVLCLIAGALFGLYWGGVAVLAGHLLAAAVQFALAHKLLRALINRIMAKRPILATIERAVRSNAFRLQVLVRLLPLNPATISYLLGAAGVRFAAFIAASLASSPNLMIEVYFGYAGKHAAMFAGSQAGTAHMHDLAMLGGLLLCVAVLVFLSRFARRAVMQAVKETDSAERPPGVIAIARKEIP